MTGLKVTQPVSQPLSQPAALPQAAQNGENSTVKSVARSRMSYLGDILFTQPLSIAAGGLNLAIGAVQEPFTAIASSDNKKKITEGNLTTFRQIALVPSTMLRDVHALFNSEMRVSDAGQIEKVKGREVEKYKQEVNAKFKEENKGLSAEELANKQTALNEAITKGVEKIEKANLTHQMTQVSSRLSKPTFDGYFGQKLIKAMNGILLNLQTDEHFIVRHIASRVFAVMVLVARVATRALDLVASIPLALLSIGANAFGKTLFNNAAYRTAGWLNIVSDVYSFAVSMLRPKTHARVMNDIYEFSAIKDRLEALEKSAKPAVEQTGKPQFSGVVHTTNSGDAKVKSATEEVPNSPTSSTEDKVGNPANERATTPPVAPKAAARTSEEGAAPDIKAV